MASNTKHGIHQSANKAANELPKKKFKREQSGEDKSKKKEQEKQKEKEQEKKKQQEQEREKEKKLKKQREQEKKKQQEEEQKKKQDKKKDKEKEQAKEGGSRDKKFSKADAAGDMIQSANKFVEQTTGYKKFPSPTSYTKQAMGGAKFAGQGGMSD